MKKGIHIVNLKKQRQGYVNILLFIHICIMSSCRKPELQISCLKSPESSGFAICLTNSGQKALTMFISLCFNNYSNDF